MRLLYYNWVDCLDPQGRGGGISGYQKRLLDALSRRGDVECVFLSSGLAHDLRPGPPRWRSVRGRRACGAARFEIVNSACLAPSHHSFGHRAQVTEPATEAVFADFLKANGPFDAVHFNALEGLPTRVLSSRQAHPGTRFILSLHNYYAFCPQVNLWQREDRHCEDFEQGSLCAECLPFQPNPRLMRLGNAVGTSFQRAGIGPGSPVYDRAVLPSMRGAVQTYRRLASARRSGVAPAAPAKPAEAAAVAFRQRREQMVELINSNCDRVLCVSQRVARIAEGFGVAPALLTTSYIGSDHADLFARCEPKMRLPRADGTAEMAYLGYMRRDKGFHFLIDALQTLDPSLASRLHFRLAAGGREPEALAALDRLRPRLASLDWHDGYRRSDLDALLANTDFGVIPSLWEDNLPQVAIELHARRIPLLTSDRGGARELAGHPPMVFRSGDAGALHACLADILGGRIDLAAYWSGARAPVTMDAHLDELLPLYAAADTTPPRKGV